MFSKACMYAIRATVLIASHGAGDRRWTLSAIVAGTGAPVAFMAKILLKLVRADILRSVKGPGGGFSMDPDRAKNLRLGDVVTAIDNDHLFAGCALGFDSCDAKKPCPIHEQVEAVRERLHGVLASTLVKDLGRELHDGKAFLKGKV